MSVRVENKPVSRRQFYATVIGVLAIVQSVALSVERSTSFRTMLEAFIVLAMLGALIELLRTRRAS